MPPNASKFPKLICRALKERKPKPNSLIHKIKKIRTVLGALKDDRDLTKVISELTEDTDKMNGFNNTTQNMNHQFIKN